MIHIEQNQNIAENENLKVATNTGDYEDTALIEFYDVIDPSIIVGAFQAQYVKYGSFVYRFNDHIELGKAILEIDPNSTHTSASYVRMTNELLAKMNNGSLEPESLDQALTTEQNNMEEQMENPPISDEEVEGNVSEEPVSEEVEEETPLEENTEETSIIDVPVEEITPEELPIEETIIEEEAVPVLEEVTPTPAPEVVPEVVPEVTPETILETEPVTMLKRKAKRIIG